MSTSSYGAAVKPVITLAPPAGPNVAAPALSLTGVPLQTPANFRHLGSATVGEPADLQTLTLRFAASTRLQTISSTPDFTIEPGGSCIEGDSYTAKGSCTLLVRFTPQGAGHRLGRLTIAHSASVSPAYVGLGGNSYTPVVSFIPAVIETVPASNPGGTGLLSGAQNLAVDGGDSLYVADTGNNVVRIYNSGGTFKTIAESGITAPVGIAADPFGEVYFSEPTSNLVYEIFEYGSVLQLSGVGTDACTVASPCSMTSEKVYTPGQMAMDSGNQLFFEDGSRGAAVAVVQPYPATLARLYDPFTYQTTSTGVFSVDAYDNIYTVWSITGLCQINAQTYSDAANSRAVYKKVAGGKFCGFGGDGGQARNASIGATIGQMAFDIAGDMYFTDASNQRVRRIDYATGIIHTIAGTGNVGNSGDGGQATSANLNSPTGIGVDSQGQVYFINSSSSTHQVIRKLGPNGLLAFFTPQLRGTTSAVKTANILNSGNSVLTITKVVFTGANGSDFSIDPNTTTCNFAAGNSLANGQSCQVGVLFKPGAAGVRSANLVLLDNTVASSNTIQLTGTGILPSPSVKITAPASGASFTSGSTVKFSMSVTSTGGSAPTGKVTFKVDGTTFGAAVTLSSGTASVNLTGLSVKTHSLSATYSGDSNYAATTASESITVKTAAVAKPSGTTVRSNLPLPAATGRELAVAGPGFMTAPLGLSTATTPGCEEKAETSSVERIAAPAAGNQPSGPEEDRSKTDAAPSTGCKTAQAEPDSESN